MPSSKELTQAYQQKNLPDGWYYFRVANLISQIGRYTKPTAYEIAAAKLQGLPVPQPVIYSGSAMFRGALQTITILATVPDYGEFTQKGQ